ncbi:MAG: twin-arginine translocase TatA/TatE family subunit [Bacteroidales bacterium]|jgi:sec-independent protein translocase protein TatA|nr:twin-arginine translocase TatA/TatE family subunit [Bacteroidales bacterium]
MLIFISGQEIFVILLVVLLLFGANKIPDIAKGLGKGMREFKKATDDIKKEMNDHTGDLKKNFEEINDDIKSGIKNTKQILKDE